MSENKPREWWTDGEYISNHMDATEVELADGDFFKVVELDEYNKLEARIKELEEKLKIAVDSLKSMKIGLDYDPTIGTDCYEADYFRRNLLIAEEALKQIQEVMK